MDSNSKPVEMALWPPVVPGAAIASLCLLVLTSLVLRLLYATVLYPEIFSPLRQIPTPQGRSFLQGTHAPPSATSRAAQLRHWSRTVPNDGLIRYRQNGNQERLLVTSTKALTEILVSNADHFGKPEAIRARLAYVAGNGVLLAEGEEHRVQRKSLMPAFSFRHIKDLYPLFWSKARELTEGIEQELHHKEVETDVIEVRGWATRATLDIIGLAGMDHDFESLQNPKNSLSRQYQQLRYRPPRFQVLLGSVASLFSSQAAVMVSKLPNKRKQQVKEASRYIRTVCQQIVQDKRGKFKSAAAQADIDIISVALKSAVFSDENLVDQMMTFLAAGHGTTSHALQWAVHALCKHDQIQHRLREEVRDRLPSIRDSESSISADDLDGLPYLHAFCNEVLRFYPSVPTTPRKALRDTTVGGYHIPKGTVITVAPCVTNVDPELWGPDAGMFNPERWMQDGCANTGGVRNNYGFLTFLHGPRSCIGATFARAELACLVAGLVGRFRMQLENPQREVEVTKGGIGAVPVDGVRTRMEVVDGW